MSIADPVPDFDPNVRSRGQEWGGASTPGLEAVGELARPVTPASEQFLAVSPALADLLPGGGLGRGSTVAVTGRGGSTSLILSLMAKPSMEGAWCAVVGLPALGVIAASELGVELKRLALVPSPGDRWATVVAALLDAFDVVAVAPPVQVRPQESRRLAARARQRRAVLLAMPREAGVRRVEPLERVWPEVPDIGLEVVESDWCGPEDGYGFLKRHRLNVLSKGRRAAGRTRCVVLCLPQGDGLGTDR